VTRVLIKDLPLERRGGVWGTGAGSGSPAADRWLDEPCDPTPVAGGSRKLLLTVEEAAKQLSIGRSHLYRYLQTGRLRSVLVGHCRRIRPQDLDDFVLGLRGTGDAGIR